MGIYFTGHLFIWVTIAKPIHNLNKLKTVKPLTWFRLLIISFLTSELAMLFDHKVGIIFWALTDSLPLTGDKCELSPPAKQFERLLGPIRWKSGNCLNDCGICCLALSMLQLLVSNDMSEIQLISAQVDSGREGTGLVVVSVWLHNSVAIGRGLAPTPDGWRRPRTCSSVDSTATIVNSTILENIPTIKWKS